MSVTITDIAPRTVNAGYINFGEPVNKSIYSADPKEEFKTQDKAQLEHALVNIAKQPTRKLVVVLENVKTAHELQMVKLQRQIGEVHDVIIELPEEHRKKNQAEVMSAFNALPEQVTSTAEAPISDNTRELMDMMSELLAYMKENYNGPYAEILKEYSALFEELSNLDALISEGIEGSGTNYLITFMEVRRTIADILYSRVAETESDGSPLVPERALFKATASEEAKAALAAAESALAGSQSELGPLEEALQRAEVMVAFGGGAEWIAIRDELKLSVESKKQEIAKAEETVADAKYTMESEPKELAERWAEELGLEAKWGYDKDGNIVYYVPVNTEPIQKLFDLIMFDIKDGVLDPNLYTIFRTAYDAQKTTVQNKLETIAQQFGRANNSLDNLTKLFAALFEAFIQDLKSFWR